MLPLYHQCYSMQKKTETSTSYMSNHSTTFITMSDINYVEEIKQRYPEDSDAIMDLDYAMGYWDNAVGKTKTVIQFYSGEWTRYDFTGSLFFTKTNGDYQVWTTGR